VFLGGLISLTEARHGKGIRDETRDDGVSKDCMADCLVQPPFIEKVLLHLLAASQSRAMF
jgi:hypothetical protein